MWRHLITLFRAVPVTWLMLFISGMVLGADNALALLRQMDFQKAQSLLGAADTHRLWDGGWWTVVTTAFHHGGLLHLLCNGCCLWWLGRLLETRLGSWRYLVFCLTATAVAGVAQSLSAPYVGLSGMLFAQFGLVWAWRRTDPWLQTYVQTDQIQWGVGWLLICLPLSWLQILPVGNVAHFSGCAYGYAAGLVYFGSARARTWKPVFLVGHLFLLPLFYFVVHPVWNGNYHWRRGDLATEPAERLRHYENAILCDPDLDGPWVLLSMLTEDEGDLLGAWNWVLRGIRLHPSYEKAITQARDLWTQFPNPEMREAARRRLQQVFGDQAPLWADTLQLDDLPELTDVKSRPQPHPNPITLEGEPLEIAEPPPFSLPPRALDEIIRPAPKIGAPDPEAPGSAEEGRAA